MTDQTPASRTCPYDCTWDRKPCGDTAEYFVNGHYACGHHLEATILLFAVTNEVGHRWASVQVLSDANANCAVCGGAPESTLHLGLPTTKGHRYEPASSADAKPSVDAVEGHGVHEHVYRCQDCGLVESDVLSDERLAANAPSGQSSSAVPES